MHDFELYWKELAKKKTLTERNFIERAILIAMRAKGNAPKEDIVHCLLQKYFTPITNKTKLANGMKPYKFISDYIRWRQIWRTKDILQQPMGNIFETTEEVKQFEELLNSINIDKLNRQYVYYFTVQDGLTAEQQGVQAGHALFVLADKLNEEKIKFNAKNIYFQWIGVKTEQELIKILIKHNKHKYVKFNEPDLGNLLTSVAFYPVLWNKREEFMEYKLLTHTH